MRTEPIVSACRALVGAISIALSVSGCGGEHAGGSDATVPVPPSAEKREIIATAWDTLWTVGGSVNDTLLLRPYLAAAAGTGIYLFDGGTNRVLAFTPEGKLKWTFGQKGSGPDEFRSVRDIKVGRNGEPHVLDPRNARIIRLDTAGRVLARIPLTTVGHAEQLTVLDSQRIVLLTMDQERAFAIVDSTGTVRDRFSLSWDQFAKLDQIARQGLIIPGRGSEWVFGFSFGDGWFRFDGATPERSARYVEHTKFPELRSTPDGGTRMAEYNACSACSASVSGSTLFVHFGGYSRHRESVIDMYDLDSSQYRGSYLLPFKASVISAAGDRIYALRDDPYPMLLAVRPRPKDSARTGSATAMNH